MGEKKALIGMSGGVDSSVAAYLMVQSGYSCIGVTMKLCSSKSIDPENSRTCCTLDDAEDARSVARRLGMPHYVFNFQEDFESQVIRRFVEAYEAGLTPNPCIDCNRSLKFGRLLGRARELGCDYVVTGHYARIRQDENTGRYLLYKAADAAKDQTYFLACLDQDQLRHIRFPLGELTKAEVRTIAESQGFVTAKKHDSQDICFIPGGDYGAFLEHYTGKTYPCGNYVNAEGTVLGTHKGAVRYTIGQRKGLGIALGAPAYVCGKDMEKNTVTLGPNEALFSRALRGSSWCWFPFPALESPMEITAKTRHSPREAAAWVYPEENGFARVEFAEPQRAVTPGQAVVLYQGDLVIGGGTITEAIPSL